jgi:hypothetical protein
LKKTGSRGCQGFGWAPELVSDEKKACTMIPEAAFLVGGALLFLFCVTAFAVLARRAYFHVPSALVVMTAAAVGALISFFPPWVVIGMERHATNAGPLYLRTEARLGHFSDPDAYLSALRRDLPGGYPRGHKEVNAGLLLAEYALMLSVATIAFLSVKAYKPIAYRRTTAPAPEQEAMK